MMPTLNIAALVDDSRAGRAAYEEAKRLCECFRGRLSVLRTESLAGTSTPERVVRSWSRENRIHLVVLGKHPDELLTAQGIRVGRLAALNVPIFAVCPVTESTTPDRGKSTPLRNVLVPSDLSENSLSALHRLSEIFDAFPQEALVYLVASGLNTGPGAGARAPRAPNSPARTFLSEFHDMAEWCMQYSVRREVGDDIVLSAEVEAGDPAREILKKADEIDADLIVLSTHGATDAMSETVGSVTSEVIRRARRCVLCVDSRIARDEESR